MFRLRQHCHHLTQARQELDGMGKPKYLSTLNVHLCQLQPMHTLEWVTTNKA